MESVLFWWFLLNFNFICKIYNIEDFKVTEIKFAFEKAKILSMYKLINGMVLQLFQSNWNNIKYFE